MTDFALEQTDADAAHLDAVAVRVLVPTHRERRLGVNKVDYEFVDAVAEADARPALHYRIRALLADMDPRRVEGSKRPLIIVGLILFVGGWDEAGFRVLLPEIQAQFGLDVAFLIQLAQTLVLVGLFVAIPLGYLADRVPRVRMVQVGAVLGALATFGQAFAPKVADLTGARVVGGLGGAVSAPAGYPLIADYYGPRSRARVFAIIVALASLGAVGGPIVAGHIANAFGWRAAVVVLGVLSSVAALLTFFLREPPRGVTDRLAAGASQTAAEIQPRPVSFWEGVRAAFSIMTFRRLCYAAPFNYAAGVGLGTLLALYFTNVFQVDPAQLGNITSLGAAVGVVGLLLAGPVADRLLADRPGRLVLLLGGVVLLQCLVLVVFALSPWLLLSVVVSLPLGLFSAMLVPASLTIFSLVIPARIRGVGLQLQAPFTLLGVFLLIALAPELESVGIRQGIMFLTPVLALGGLITMSASVGVDRDIRAARAAAMADEAAIKARQSGRNKMLVCRDLDIHYGGVQVLFNVDFDVDEGDIIALLGTNGAGKSSLLRAIAGVREASNGAIFLDGRDITHAPPHENAVHGVVMMPGGNAVFPTLTVRENLRTAAWMHRNESPAEVEARLADVLSYFPVLRDRLGHIAGNLSGGEQQMVGLAQAFLMRPRLLMIDELSLGLAPAVIEKLLAILRDIHGRGTTIILVEQSVNVALTIAERAVFMEKGEIRFSGRTEELMARPDLLRAVFMGGAAPTGSARTSPRGPMQGPAEAVLSVDAISVRLGGVQALNAASLTVQRTQIVGIIGPNGAGKTTLFDVISGFVIPDEGRVALEATDFSGLSPDARARVGLARSFQNARLFGSLTVRETVAVALERKASRNPLLAAIWAPPQRRSEVRLLRRADGLIELFGLGAYAGKYINELSTGTRRAVDMACIMAAEPKMLLLDEPSSGLAQAETEELGPVLQRVNRETGCGMLVIEHDLRLVTGVSDVLVAMELGAVVAVGSPASVVTDPRVLSSYLAASADVIERSGNRVATIAAAIGAPVPVASTNHKSREAN